MRRLVRRALTPGPPKPERLVEEEVAPGPLLLTLRARRSLAVIFAVVGLGMATGPVTSQSSTYSGPAWTLVLPPGRRLDPVL